MAKNRKFKLTKDAFLDALRRGDKSINAICKEHGYSSASTVANWRKKDHEFDARVTEILSSPAHQLRLKNESGTTEERSDPKDKFKYWYAREYDRDGACTYAGIEPGDVLRWLDPGDEAFDKEFGYWWEQQQIRRKWKLEDDSHKDALERGSENMRRFLLPALLPETYAKSRAAQVNIDRVNVFNASALADAAAFLKGIFEPTATEEHRAIPAASTRP